MSIQKKKSRSLIIIINSESAEICKQQYDTIGKKIVGKKNF